MRVIDVKAHAQSYLFATKRKTRNQPGQLLLLVSTVVDDDTPDALSERAWKEVYHVLYALALSADGKTDLRG
jgi:hypothetical protein